MGDLSFKEEKVIKTLLIFNQVRGDDATGVASVSRLEKPDTMELAKEVGPPCFLFDTRRFDKVFQGNNCVYIGHNRSKTVGENTRKNAHPFKFEDILGAHNGTLDWQNKSRLEDGNSFKTDSEAIFNNIQMHGIEDTISRIDKTEAYALTWYDKRTHTMNFIRNEQRPLIYCTVNDGTALFWGSEFGILMAALSREGLKPDKTVWDFTADYVYTWNIPTTLKTKIGEPTRKKVENHVQTWSGKKTHYTKPETKTTVGSEVQVCSKNENGMVYKGLYIGWVPEEATSTTDILQKVDDGIEAVRKACGLLTGSSTGKASSNKGMSPDDVIRRQALERAEKAGFLPVENEDVRSVFRGHNLKVWRKSSDGSWITLRFNWSRSEWEKFETRIPPHDLPYTCIDINARHCFQHIGRKKKKKIYYKGWKTLLDRSIFETMMKEGCTNCERKPEWGNEVVFISPQHDFLCEYCAMTPQLVESFLQVSKNLLETKD